MKSRPVAYGYDKLVRELTFSYQFCPESWPETLEKGKMSGEIS